MAMILDAFMSKFSELLMQMVQDKVGILLGIPGEIEKLEQTMGDIQCVIADAERRQTESLAMKRWLMELKDVMYDADDIMDLCQIKAQERLDHCDSPSSSKLGRFSHYLFSHFRNPAFDYELATKIKEINSRLEEIANRKDKLALIAIQTVAGHPPIHRADSLISRKTDQLVVMEDLVGEKIEEDTELVVNWLTEQEDSMRSNISVVAIVGMGGVGKTTLAKRIFNDSKIEEEFKLKIWACVSKEVKGAKLLKCIIREAGGEHGAAQERSELVPILHRVIKGKKFFLVLDDVWPESLKVWDGILRDPMSGGAKGSRLLVTTRDERVVNGIRATKSHYVDKMSDEDEGFLQDNENLLELGNEYYTELLSRNLLEKTHEIGLLLYSKMHDLFWSFARYLGKDENLIVRKGEAFSRESNIPKLRRLSIEQKEVKTQLFEKENSLRTLLINDISQKTLVDVCKTLHNLRILELRNFNITTIPDSIGVLIHLRHLRIHGDIRTIPNSIGYLRNLTCLDVSKCEKLQHVPSSIINLKQLRCLDLHKTKVEGIPAGLKNLEKLIEFSGFELRKSGSEGFSTLHELETLTQLNILSLHGLKKVIDKNIAKRAKLQCKNKLKFIGFKYRTLSWEDQVLQTNEKKATIEEILNELCPSPSIEYICIEGYYGSCLPKWLNSGITLSNLRVLIILYCHCFENLPALGQLSNLNTLRISAHSILKVGEEFLWGDVKSSNISFPAFPKLDKLIFKILHNWKEWQWNKGESAMPKLKKILIEDCPQLISLSEGLLHHATSLENLEIIGANNLIIVENLPFIKKIQFSRNPNLKKNLNMPRLSNILIRDCSNLKTMESLDALQRMRLLDFEMQVLPEYLMAVTLQKLRIDCSEELLRKITSQGENGSEWHKVNHIPRVTINSPDGSLYTTYQKEPFSFTTNIRP